MKTLKLTEKDFRDTDYYWKEYVGKTDVSDYDGNIEIDSDLGWVRFASLKASGCILAGSNTGIEADYSIETGWSIEAGTSIEAGGGIKAGGDIEAGDSIKAVGDIETIGGIKAGSSIKAGEDIKAGEGIEAGLSITCGGILKFNYRLFAGTAAWRDIDDEDKTITCGKLEGGTVCYGEVVETGLPEEKIVLTMDDIAEKFGVSVERLKIKKQK